MRAIVEYAGGSPARRVEELPVPETAGPISSYALAGGAVTAMTDGVILTTTNAKMALPIDATYVREFALALLAAAENGGWQ